MKTKSPTTYALASFLFIALCVVPSFAKQAIVVGIDLTVEEFNAVELVDAVMAAINRQGKDGAIIFVIAITGHTLTQPIVLAQTQIPDYVGIKGKDRRKVIDQLQQTLLNKVDKERRVAKKLLRQSRIADFFIFAKSYFDEYRIPAKARQMLIISDMLLVDERRNWERKGDPDSNNLKIPHLGGTVSIYGVRSSKYQDADKWTKVRDAWTGLLASAGVKVQTYSNVLPR